MELQKIKDLIDLASAADLASFEYTEGECTLRLERCGRAACTQSADSPQAPRSPAVSGDGPRPMPEPPVGCPARPEADVVSAPMLGILYLSPKPGEPPFVAIGEVVRKGQKLCLLEAMKVFHVVEARRDGVVREVLAREGQEVELGQPLFRIE